MRSILLMLLVVGACYSQDQTIADDLSALHAGVKNISSPGSPGQIAIFGRNAFAVVVDTNPAMNPAVGAGKLSKGRVMAFGHGGYLEAGLKEDDTLLFVKNALIWTANAAKGNQPINVIAHGFPNLKNDLPKDSFTVSDSNGADWVPAFQARTVLVVSPGQITTPVAEKIGKFVEAGGGLVVAMPGWGWLQLNKGKTLDRDFAINQILAKAGLVIADGSLTRKGNSIPITKPSLATNSTIAVQQVETWLSGGEAPKPADVEPMRAAIIRMSDAVPATITEPLMKRLTLAIRKTTLSIPVPTEKKPTTTKDPNSRLLLGLTTQLSMAASIDNIVAHPAAKEFPGNVPFTANRIKKDLTLKIDSTGYICDGVGVSANVDIWHSTGLYAAPGEVITLTLPLSTINEGLGLRIGCHTDSLWNLTKWERAPEISKHVVAKGQTTKLANPFGGLVYVTAPRKATIPALKVTIEGAVESPRFVRGKTTLAEWREMKKLQAPWAEFEANNLIISTPVANAIMVEDPEALLKFWDEVMDACADLTCVSKKRGRAERLVHDVQISAGYMHSGYPIMCPLGELTKCLDHVKIQREGAWGYFHEIGHNHQQTMWTFDGTTEVTCNLYSLYCYGLFAPKAELHDAMRPNSIKRNATKYRNGGSKFATWQAEPFVALIMYYQLQQAFGWDAYKKAFTAYQAMPRKDRPKNDAAERDEWLVQISQATGKNLAPFFDHWGIPVTPAAKAKVANLAKWDFPDATK